MCICPDKFQVGVTHCIGGYPIKDSLLARGSLALDRVRSTQSPQFARHRPWPTAKQRLHHASVDHKQEQVERRLGKRPPFERRLQVGPEWRKFTAGMNAVPGWGLMASDAT